MIRNLFLYMTLCLLSGINSFAQQTPAFSVPKIYKGSANSVSAYNFVTRDFNKDGYPEIAAAYGSGEFSVFFSNSSGVYTNRSAKISNFSNYAIAAADFNNDGVIELAIVNDAGLQLLDGGGTFNTGYSQQTKATGASPRYVAAADINNDFYDDLIVSCYSDTSVYVFTNTHSGFTSKRYKVGLRPRKFVTADLNQDGFMDICGINEGEQTVFVLMNAGGGLYNPVVLYNNGVIGADILTADVNNDGYPEMIVGNYYSTENVTLFVNNGDGTFNTPLAYAGGVSPRHMLSTDFNSDGYADLAFAVSRDIYIYLGTASGTFNLKGTFNTAQQTTYMAIADYNGDSKTDIISVGQGTGSFTVMPGDGSGGFGAIATYSAIDSYGAAPLMVAPADYNKDGQVDVATVNGPSISLITGNPDHTYNSPINVHFEADFLVSADYNNDGIADIAGAGRYTRKLAVCLGRGDGRFDTLTSKKINDAKGIVTGDFNGDHNMDLAVGFDAGFIGSANGKVTIYLGRGNGLFDSTSTFNTSGGDNLGMVAADFNRDGYDDLAVACSYDNNYAFKAFLSLQNGFFSNSQTLHLGYAGYYGVLFDVAAGDINNDQKMDLLVGGRSGTFVLLGAGNGTFTSTKILTVGTIFVMLDDYNNDGKLDFVIRTEDNYSSCYVYLGAGNGALASSSFKALSNTANPESIPSFSADLNGDGFKDIVTRTASNYGFSIFLGKGDGDFYPGITYTSVNTIGECIAADFNGDGKRDIAFGGAAGNDRLLDIMLNNGIFTGFPAHPSALTATPDALTINLSWIDNSSTETGFIIERSTSPYYGFTSIDTVSTNVVAYTDPSVIAGTTYYYRVRAIDQLQTSSYSNRTSAGVTVTGITDAELTTNEATIYPNPANGQDGFRILPAAEDHILEIVLINASGKQESHHSEVIYTGMKGLLIVKIRTEKGVCMKKMEVF